MLCNRGWWNLMSSKNIILISVLGIPVFHWHCDGFEGIDGGMGWLPPHRNFRSPLCPDQSRLGTPDSTFKRFGLFRNPRPSRHHHQEVRLLIPSWRVFGICPPRGHDNQVRLLIPSWRDLKLAADISVVTVFPASSVLSLTSRTPSGTQS